MNYKFHIVNWLFFVFLPRHLFAGSPMGGKWVKTHRHKRRTYALWFWLCVNLANSKQSVRNKATGTPREGYIECIIGSWLCYALCWCEFQHTWRGAFSVARFDRLGDARAYTKWNEWQDWLHVFYCICANLKHSTKKDYLELVVIMEVSMHSSAFYSSNLNAQQIFPAAILYAHTFSWRFHRLRRKNTWQFKTGITISYYFCTKIYFQFYSYGIKR